MSRTNEPPLGAQPPLSEESLLVDRPERLLRSALWRNAIAPTLVLRFVFIGFGFLALMVLGEEALPRGAPLEILNRWDVRHYLDIAANGYGPGNETLLVFFPLLPALIAVASLVLEPMLAGVVISLAASLFAAAGLYILARMDFGVASATAAVLMMSLFPTAFALVVPYTEALFLALAVWAFVFARRGHWWAAALVVLLASLTRLPGIFLLPALAIEYWQQHRRLERDVLWLALPLAGPLLYLGINVYATGDPLYFLYAQREVFNNHTVAPWVSLQNLIDGVLRLDFGHRWATLYVAPLAGLLLLWVVTIWALIGRGGRLSYAVYALLSLISLASISWPISVPRYLMAVFPIFLAAGALVRTPWVAIPLFVGSALCCALLTALFVMGRWAF